MSYRNPGPHFEIGIFSAFSTASQKGLKDKKNVSSSQDSNPGLPIQSQVWLPLDQGFMKIAWKMKNFWPGFLKYKF